MWNNFIYNNLLTKDISSAWCLPIIQVSSSIISLKFYKGICWVLLNIVDGQKNNLLSNYKEILQKSVNSVQCKRIRWWWKRCQLQWNWTDLHHWKESLCSCSDTRKCSCVLSVNRDQWSLYTEECRDVIWAFHEAYWDDNNSLLAGEFCEPPLHQVKIPHFDKTIRKTRFQDKFTRNFLSIARF